MDFSQMVDMVCHHYHLDDWQVRRLTLRQIKRKIENIPHVNPMVGTGEGDVSASDNPPADDDVGTLNH